jgi:hypothetical protein
VRGSFEDGKVTPTAHSNEAREEQDRVSEEDACGRTSVCVRNSSPKGDLQ